MRRARRRNGLGRCLVPVIVLVATGCGGPRRSVAPVPSLRDWPVPPDVPELWEPGTFSTTREEYRVTFTPDGNTAFWAVGEGFFPTTRRASIVTSRRVDGRWTAPETAAFSGRYPDLDPFVAPDGRRIYWSSIRPVGGKEREDVDLWMANREGDGWGEPVHLGPAVNGPGDDLFPSVDRGGILYWASDAPGGRGGFDLYRSVPVAGAYTRMENLGGGVNTPLWEFNPAVSPDGLLLVFTALRRPTGKGLGDLYVSRRIGHSIWDIASNLGAPVNTAADEFHPSWGPDGRTLFFVRRGPGLKPQGDLYRVRFALPQPFTRPTRPTR